MKRTIPGWISRGDHGPAKIAMTKPVGHPASLGFDEGTLDTGGERRTHRCGVCPAHQGQPPRRERAMRDAGREQKVTLGSRQPLQSRGQQTAQVVRAVHAEHRVETVARYKAGAAIAHDDLPALEEQPQQLDRVQRKPRGGLTDGFAQRLRGRHVAEYRYEQRLEV